MPAQTPLWSVHPAVRREVGTNNNQLGQGTQAFLCLSLSWWGSPPSPPSFTFSGFPTVHNSLGLPSGRPTCSPMYKLYPVHILSRSVHQYKVTSDFYSYLSLSDLGTKLRMKTKHCLPLQTSVDTTHKEQIGEQGHQLILPLSRRGGAATPSADLQMQSHPHLRHSLAFP